MRKRTRAALVGAAALVPVTLTATATPAAAHTSGYCGHGISLERGGIIVSYQYSVVADGHMHLYYHDHLFSTIGDHYEWKICPRTVVGDLYWWNETYPPY